MKGPAAPRLLAALALAAAVAWPAAAEDKSCAQWLAEARDPARLGDVLVDMGQVNSQSAYCPELVPLAVKALAHEDETMRGRAPVALWYVAVANADPLRPHLAAIAAAHKAQSARAAKVPDEFTTMMNVLNLHKVLGKLGPEAVASIAGDAVHVSKDVRWSAAAVLQEMGAEAAAALPQLKSAHEAEKDQDVRAALAAAITSVAAPAPGH